MREWAFNTFWMAGFECSCQRLRDGRRLDLTAATGHERWAAADYARLRSVGIGTVREGIAWHRSVTPSGRLDLSCCRPLALVFSVTHLEIGVGPRGG